METQQRKLKPIPEGHKRCQRCKGQKKLYKVPGGFSSVNTGGRLVDCPLCLGLGHVKKLETKVKELKEKKGGSSDGKERGAAKREKLGSKEKKKKS